MTRAIDVIRKVAPKARPNYVRAFETGDALLQQHEISTPDRLAHFLAQVLHESGGLTNMRTIFAIRNCSSMGSTLAAILSGTSLRVATAIASSIPFSGDIRPRKARYCPARGWNVNASVSMPL